MTNADKVRQMTDEEMARWYFMEFFGHSPYCKIASGCPPGNDCLGCMLEWLGKEAVND